MLPVSATYRSTPREYMSAQAPTLRASFAAISGAAKCSFTTLHQKNFGALGAIVFSHFRVENIVFSLDTRFLFTRFLFTATHTLCPCAWCSNCTATRPCFRKHSTANTPPACRCHHGAVLRARRHLEADGAEDVHHALAHRRRRVVHALAQLVQVDASPSFALALSRSLSKQTSQSKSSPSFAMIQASPSRSETPLRQAHRRGHWATPYMMKALLPAPLCVFWVFGFPHTYVRYAYF